MMMAQGDDQKTPRGAKTTQLVVLIVAVALLLVGIVAALSRGEASPDQSATTTESEQPEVDVIAEVLPADAHNVQRDAVSGNESVTFAVSRSADDVRNSLGERLRDLDWSFRQRDTIDDITRLVYDGPDGSVLTVNLAATPDGTDVAMLLSTS